MKASTILIEKSKGVRQTIKRYVTFGNDKKITAYCALGLLACKSRSIGRYSDFNAEINHERLEKLFGINDAYTGQCPSLEPCDVDFHLKEVNTIGKVIVHLNDHHIWNFVKIGAWLLLRGY